MINDNNQLIKYHIVNISHIGNHIILKTIQNDFSYFHFSVSLTIFFQKGIMISFDNSLKDLQIGKKTIVKENNIENNININHCHHQNKTARIIFAKKIIKFLLKNKSYFGIPDKDRTCV